MKAAVSALPAYLRLSLATMLQYRGEIVLWAIWGVVAPVVALAMWKAAIKGNAASDQIGGFDAGAFAAYYLMTMVVGHLATAWDVYEMGYQVRSGALSPKLLRPIHPIWERISDNISYKVLTLVILVPIWVVIGVLVQPTFEADRTDVLLGIPAALLAAALSFLWCYNAAMLAFFITRMEAVGEIWFGLSLLLGGRLAPLSIMPEPLQWAAAALPFQWIIWFPSAALTGKLDQNELLAGLGYQTLWLAVGLAILMGGWRVSVKRYSAVGA